jgi:hypothetical protein
MRASSRFSVIALACLSNICLIAICLSNRAAAQSSDQIVAERVLGPQWRQLSRRAGMIFAGTVTAAPQSVTTERMPTDRPDPGPAPEIRWSFRVDEAIAGVEPGQILTIHEWTGAWSMQRPMRAGEHILIFLYPPSRLGLTSPVGGPLGQFDLDQTGKYVANHERKSFAPEARESVSVVQLERAIRSAREE